MGKIHNKGSRASWDINLSSDILDIHNSLDPEISRWPDISHALDPPAGGIFRMNLSSGQILSTPGTH
jgi:hypothetical protein